MSWKAKKAIALASFAIVLVVVLPLVLKQFGGGGDNTPATVTSTLPEGWVEVAYDDDVHESDIAVDGGGILMVLFTPPTYPFLVHGVRYLISMSPAEVDVHLLSGAPPTGDLVPKVQSTPQLGWNTEFFEVDYVIRAGSVFVGLTPTSDGKTWIGADTSKPVRRKTWVDFGEGPTPINDVTGVYVDAAIRLLGEPIVTTSTTSTSTTSTSTSTTSTTSSSSTTSTINVVDFNLVFSFMTGECGASRNFTAFSQDNKIFFRGYSPAPTPCYRLFIDKSAKGNTLTLTLSSMKEDRICVFCRGAVPFSGEISGLPSKGVYEVVFIDADETVVRESVYLNLTPVAPPPSECEINSDCGTNYYGNFRCIQDRPMRPHYLHLCIGGRCIVKSEVDVEETRTCDEMGLD